MGFLNKLKEIFKTETTQIKQTQDPEQKVERVDLEKLDEFLKDNKLKIGKLIQEKKENYNNDLLKILARLEENLEILSNADISKKRDNERLKQMAESGKEHYVKLLFNFIKNIKNEQSGIDNLDEKLERFIQQSQKSYAKATTLIGKEMEPVGKDITEIRKLGKRFNEDSLGLFRKQNDLKLLLKRQEEKFHNNSIKLEIFKEIEKIKTVIQTNKGNLESTTKKIEEIKEGADYKRKESLMLEKIKKQEDLKRVESRVKALLDRKILEKYYHLEKNNPIAKVIREYINDPSNKLLSDTGLQISDMLEDIKKKIKNNTLEVKEPEKIIKKIDIPKDVFLRYRNKIILLNNDINDVEKNINKLDMSLSGLDIILKEKSRIENGISTEKENLENLNKKHLKLEKVISNLNSDLKILLERY